MPFYGMVDVAVARVGIGLEHAVLDMELYTWLAAQKQTVSATSTKCEMYPMPSHQRCCSLISIAGTL